MKRLIIETPDPSVAWHEATAAIAETMRDHARFDLTDWTQFLIDMPSGRGFMMFRSNISEDIQRIVIVSDEFVDDPANESMLQELTTQTH